MLLENTESLCILHISLSPDQWNVFSYRAPSSRGTLAAQDIELPELPVKSLTGALSRNPLAFHTDRGPLHPCAPHGICQCFLQSSEGGFCSTLTSPHLKSTFLLFIRDEVLLYCPDWSHIDSSHLLKLASQVADITGVYPCSCLLQSF